MADNKNFGHVSDWYSSESIENLERTVRPGDSLEFYRGLFLFMYAHWGIYVGPYKNMEHAVIHVGIWEGGFVYSIMKLFGCAFAANRKPEILADTIGDILGSFGNVRVNNLADQIFQPLDPDAIIEEAKTMHQNKTPIDYNLFERNCEHFVNLCRYGKSYSQQIFSVIWTLCAVFLLLFMYWRILYLPDVIEGLVPGELPGDVVRDIFDTINFMEFVPDGTCRECYALGRTSPCF